MSIQSFGKRHFVIKFICKTEKLPKAACKRTQQLGFCVHVVSGVQTDATELQQCWDLQCIVGRIQPITSLYKPCVMSVRGPNNFGRAVQTDPTLLCYASAIEE